MQRVNERDQAYRGGDSGVKYLFRGPRIDWGVILLKPGESLGGHYQEVGRPFTWPRAGTFVVNERLAAEAGGPVPHGATDRHDILTVRRRRCGSSLSRRPTSPTTGDVSTPHGAYRADGAHESPHSHTGDSSRRTSLTLEIRSIGVL